MANIYKNAGFALSTTNLTTVYTVPTDRTAIVKSIQINNDDASAIQTEISVTDSSASATYKIYHKDLAADTTDNGVVAPLVLESGDIVKIQVATANKIEGMISYLEIFDEKQSFKKILDILTIQKKELSNLIHSFSLINECKKVIDGLDDDVSLTLNSLIVSCLEYLTNSIIIQQNMSREMYEFAVKVEIAMADISSGMRPQVVLSNLSLEVS